MQEDAEQISFVKPLPLNEQDWMLRGSVHQFQKRFKEAITDYGNAIASNPQNAFAYTNRGIVYTKQEQYDRAISDYNYAIQLDPTLTQVYINRAITAKKQGRYTDALEDFELALQQDPRNSAIWCDKGSTLSEASRYEEALAAYAEALRLNPQNIDIYLGKGIVCNLLGQYEEALAAYEEAVRLDPQNSNAHRGKGTALYELKRYIQASLAYDEALRIDPYTTNQFNEQTDLAILQILKLQQYIPHEEENNLKNERMDTEANRYPFTITQRLKESQFSSVRRSFAFPINQIVQAILTFLSMRNMPPVLPVVPMTPVRSHSRRRRNSGAFIGLLCVLALIAASSYAVVNYIQASATSAAHEMATRTASPAMATKSTIIASTATAQAQATETNVQENPSPSYFPGEGQLALYDPLKNDSEGYQWLPREQLPFPPANGNCAFKKGGLDASVDGNENYNRLLPQ